MKPTVKINFCDFWPGFDPESNFIMEALSRFCSPVIDPQPDFLFYSCYSMNYTQYTDCVKIYYAAENVCANFNECDYAFGFDQMEFGDRYLYFPAYFLRLLPEMQKRDITPDLLKRKFCNFVYSNGSYGDGAKKRQDFCKELMKYKPVDCAGKVLNNMKSDILSGRWDTSRGESKIKFTSLYKFTISWENTFGSGYVSEKLIEPLIAQSVPIYWGGDSMVKRECYVNVRAYSDFDSVIEKIIQLDNDDTLYLSMLEEPPFHDDFNFDIMGRLSDFFCTLIKKGNCPYIKDPQGHSSLMQVSRKHEQAFMSRIRKKIGHLFN